MMDEDDHDLFHMLDFDLKFGILVVSTGKYSSALNAAHQYIAYHKWRFSSSAPFLMPLFRGITLYECGEVRIFYLKWPKTAQKHAKMGS
jgi:hypothetical protein